MGRTGRRHHRWGSADRPRSPAFRGVAFARMLERVPDDVGRLSEVRGDVRQRQAARVAHYLWWVEDLDRQAQVAHAMVEGFTLAEVVWGCRWGPPWNATIVARAMVEGLSPHNTTTRGFGRQPFGEILCLLYAAGCTDPEELIPAVTALGIDEVRWVFETLTNVTPLTVEQVVAGYRRLTLAESPQMAAVVKARGVPDLTTRELVDLVRSLVSCSEEAARSLVKRDPGEVAAPVPMRALPHGVARAWSRARNLREDGLERSQAAVQEDEMVQFREAYGVLRNACDEFSDALARTRAQGNHWLPVPDGEGPVTLASAIMSASNCYRDAGDAALELGDLDESILLTMEALDLARRAGQEHGLAQASNNLAVQLIRRSRTADLVDAERLLDDAERLYAFARAPSVKLRNVDVNRGFLAQARRGEQPDIPTEGIRTRPWIPAHKKSLILGDGSAREIGR